MTLAPGTDSGVLLASDEDVNVDRIKSFLARPDALQVESAAFELVNAQGFNFAFIEEVTQARTARVSIDFGDGRFEEYRVATNVNRNPDSSLAGITMNRVMDLTVGPGNWESRVAPASCFPGGGLVLWRVRDLDTELDDTPRFWSVFYSGDQVGGGIPFDSAVLRNGETVLIALSKDEDGDGMLAAQEQQFGSLPIEKSAL